MISKLNNNKNKLEQFLSVRHSGLTRIISANPGNNAYASWNNKVCYRLGLKLPLGSCMTLKQMV